MSTCVIIMFTCDLSYIHVDINKSHVNNTSCLACREQNYANIRLVLGHLLTRHTVMRKAWSSEGFPVALSLCNGAKAVSDPIQNRCIHERTLAI